jgi:hypothetical protein
MMRQLTFLGLLCACSFVNAQPTTPAFNYRPSFSAIIVSDVRASSEWYQSVLSLKVRDKIADENAGYDIQILEAPAMTLELLQIRNSVTKKDALTGKPEGAEVRGYFKFGVTVADINACLSHLKSLNITVPQIYTDAKTKKKNFLITDPDGNLIQFFEE